MDGRTEKREKDCGMKINELFDYKSDSLEWIEKSNDRWIVSFIVNDRKSTLTIDRDSQKIEGEYFDRAYVTFYGIKKSHLNPEREISFISPDFGAKETSFKILSTIVNIVFNYAKEINPDYFKFDGELNNGLGSLYSKMIKFLLKKIEVLDYDFLEKDSFWVKDFVIFNTNTMNAAMFHYTEIW